MNIRGINSIRPRYYLWLLPLVVPLVLEGYLLRLAIITTLTVTVAATLNILFGYTGLASVGHAAFYGIGGYTSAILVAERGVPVMASIAIATVFVAIITLIISVPLLRTRGLYFSIITLAFNIVVYQVMLNWQEVTNGSIGYQSIPTFSMSTGWIFAMVYIFFLIVMVLKVGLVRSHIGKALIAIRDDEQLAAEIGINVLLYKVFSFVLSAALAGTTGALFAHYSGFLAPAQFTIFDSFTFFVIVTVGGAGTIMGPIVGGVLLTLAPEAFRVAPELRLVGYGLLLVLVVLLFPQGIVGAIRDNWQSVKTRVNQIKPKKTKEGEKHDD